MKIMETGTSNACICKNLRHDLYGEVTTWVNYAALGSVLRMAE